MKILILSKPETLELAEDFKLLSVSEYRDLIISKTCLEFPCLKLKFLALGKTHEFGITAPMFSIKEGSQFKNYMVWNNQNYQPPYSADNYRVVNSFATYLFKKFQTGYNDETIILDLTSESLRFIFESDFMGCGRCTERDEFILGSAFTLGEILCLETQNYSLLKTQLESAGFTENIENGFHLKDFMALKEVYRVLKEGCANENR